MNSLNYSKTKSLNNCRTELFPIYQNNIWAIRRWDNHTVLPSPTVPLYYIEDSWIFWSSWMPNNNKIHVKINQGPVVKIRFFFYLLDKCDQFKLTLKLSHFFVRRWNTYWNWSNIHACKLPMVKLGNLQWNLRSRVPNKDYSSPGPKWRNWM